jgi:hypothetical protein
MGVLRCRDSAAGTQRYKIKALRLCSKANAGKTCFLAIAISLVDGG